MTKHGVRTGAGLVLGWLAVGVVAVLVEFGLEVGLNWPERAASWTVTPPAFIAFATLARWAARRHGRERPPSEP